MKALITTAAFTLISLSVITAQNALAQTPATSPSTRFSILAMAETGGQHGPYVIAAKKWLAERGAVDNFTVDYITNANKINEDYLSHYQVFIQLNYPPYNWNPTAVAAFQKFIDEGKIGWIGFHHASLLAPSDGYFDGFPMWPWFINFMGGITWKDYNAKFASADVYVEDRNSPIMQGVPDKFHVGLEEWYTWDKSPRPNVHVLASVDESTYVSLDPVGVPDNKLKKMGGDHPVIWSNPHVAARNVYIFMGHSPILFDIDAYKTIFRNSIFWAAGKTVPGNSGDSGKAAQ